MIINESVSRQTDDANFCYGNWLSAPPPGEEVVISGMSGRLPDSNNIYEFRDNLFAKKEMVSDDDRRWKTNHPEIPQRTAKIVDINKLDAGFFGIHYRQAEIMDPQMRSFLETVIEAIVDAGVNPSELEGSRTGVFVSVSWSDIENLTLVNITEQQKFGITGYLRSIYAHRISYYLKLRGPSCIADTACSSSMNALDLAFRSIRSGRCDNAIIGCANLLVHPGNSLQFFRLGVLSLDGICKVFDNDADGYVRGETIASIFLQKAKNSRRIYAQIIHTKANSDGFKEQGITFPSTESQKQLMMEIYEESGINPSELSFLEAHGTGTQVGDPQEVEAIDLALATRREEPLLVGSVKSSIGHTEPCSGVCSLIKVLLAMETGVITPNINLKRIKEGMKGFEEGRMKVVTELTDLEGEEALVGINNFGFGGSNVHMILKRFKKKKIDGGMPNDDIPRIVCMSGRTEKSVLSLLNHVNSTDLDKEYVRLLHQIYEKNISGHLYRGFTIVSKSGLTETSVKLSEKQKCPLHIFFGRIETTFKILKSYLLKFPVFKSALSRITEILDKQKCFMPSEIEDCKILGPFCVQLAIVALLKKIEIIPAAVYGDFYGKIACAYYQDSISLEKAILMAVEMKLSLFQPEIYSEYIKKPNDFIRNVEGKNDITKKMSRNFSIHKNGSKAENEGVILNVSDTHLTTEEMLLVENGNIKFLQVLGSLYEQGHNPKLRALYPNVELPVSRGTPMVSPFIQWQHSKSWSTYKFSEFTISDSEQQEYNYSYLYDEHKFIAGHVIDGRNLFPATEYLHFVWQSLAQSRRMLVNDTCVVFKDCKFVRALTMPESGFLKLLVTIQRGTGNFEILEKNSLVVSGTVFLSGDINEHQTDPEPVELAKERSKILEEHEVYQELFLRGYNYSGAFKGITKCNTKATSGLVRWENNWSSFMDKMLQMKILQADTRLLHVPVGIKRLTVNAKKHLEIAESCINQESHLPVYLYKGDVIKSGGIEICGLQSKTVFKKKSRLEPVLEKQVFIPYCDSLELSEAVRVNTQIILENSLENHFKCVEIIDDNSNPNLEPLSFIISDVLADVPMVTPDLTISTKDTVEEKLGVKVDNVTLSSESNLLLIVGSKIFKNASNLKNILNSLNKEGFVLTREEKMFVPKTSEDIVIVTEYSTPNEKLILFKKSQNCENTECIEVSSTNFKWLTKVQKLLSNNSEIVLYCKNEEPEGLLGLVNCLRREPKGNKVKCVFIMDVAPHFNMDDILYKHQIKKNLAVNIFKNNTWGTYRHLLLEKKLEVECAHCYANIRENGNLSTFEWFEGRLTKDISLENNRILVSTYYTAINFKDVMIATGRVGVEAFTANRIVQDCLIGFEFSGKDKSGRRLMGMLECGGISSLVVADPTFWWEIPDHWSLEDAATVPVVYSTVIYALLLIKPLKPGCSVLIHSATGGIGLAALNVCTYYGCDIFVTVGTKEKRDYLKKHYPQIPENHIGNSRDTSFEEMVKTQTKNRGVDFVLNSLSDDKLKASVRCLAKGGLFLEIGKFDLANDTSLDLLFMKNDISYHGVMLDKIQFNSPERKTKIVEIISNGIKAGFVKPLPKTVFDRSEVENANRYMMTGKHIGKVLLRIRNEDEKTSKISEETYFKATPRFWCRPQMSYIIVGGLGGVGLELADWLVMRGATNIVLVSRFGVQTGSQKRHINILESYGAKISISTYDVTTIQGCRNLIKETQNQGPIDGIFNLAVVLKDAIFEEQSEEDFAISLAPKAQATKYLDQITRESCPDLRYFVVFSSVSCGRGNAGQTNYGMANSVMERICEKRKEDGLPAVAIQWGAIGEVGLVAKMQKENKELVIGGTLQQKISNCLNCLDIFLKQDSPIVSSMVVAEKHNRSCDFLSAVEAVAYVLGIKDMKTVSQHSTLAELGMDSMMGTEILQLLEKDFDIYLTTKDVRSLTFARLTELEAERNAGILEKTGKAEQGANMLIQSIPISEVSGLPTIILNSQNVENPDTTVFVLTGMEGVFKPLETLTAQLKARVVGIQYNYHNPEDRIEEVALNMIQHIEANSSETKTFLLICYSFGTVVGTELVSLLEEKGYLGKAIFIDGSPTYLTSSVKTYFPCDTESEFETALVLRILAILLPLEVLDQHKHEFLKCANLNERLDLAVNLIPPEIKKNHKLEKQAAVALQKRLKAILKYRFNHEKIKSKIYLFKAKFPIVDVEDDYQLTKLCDKEVKVVTIDGNHVTMLQELQLAAGINDILQS